MTYHVSEFLLSLKLWGTLKRIGFLERIAARSKITATPRHSFQFVYYLLFCPSRRLRFTFFPLLNDPIGNLKHTADISRGEPGCGAVLCYPIYYHISALLQITYGLCS